MCSATSRVSGSEVEAARRWRAPSADGSSPWAELGLQPRTEELEAIREAARAEGYAAGLAQGVTGSVGPIVNSASRLRVLWISKFSEILGRL